MLSRELKIGIIGGVVSSILVIIFIQPLLNYVWTAVLSFGEHIQASYVDKIFRSAAIGDRGRVSQLTFLMVILVVISVPSFLFLSQVAYRYAVFEKANRVFLLVMSFMSLMLVMVSLVSFSISMGVTEINASFNQRLTVLAPAISEHETKELKAQWAKMSSKRDYRALVSLMEKRASELQIQLPELKDPTGE